MDLREMVVGYFAVAVLVLCWCEWELHKTSTGSKSDSAAILAVSVAVCLVWPISVPLLLIARLVYWLESGGLQRLFRS